MQVGCRTLESDKLNPDVESNGCETYKSNRLTETTVPKRSECEWFYDAPLMNPLNRLKRYYAVSSL